LASHFLRRFQTRTHRSAHIKGSSEICEAIHDVLLEAYMDVFSAHLLLHTEVEGRFPFAAKAVPVRNPIATLRRIWRHARKFPGGPGVLSWVLGHFVPYAGSVRPYIVELQPGHVRLTMPDRRAVRNHLKSVHAIALANLAEMTTGLAVTISLNDNQRAILTDFSIKFLKKARGTVTSVCRFEVPTDFAEGDLSVPVDLLDPAGVTVATATATWKIGLQ